MSFEMAYQLKEAQQHVLRLFPRLNAGLKSDGPKLRMTEK